jgi:hypothetical protein
MPAVTWGAARDASAAGTPPGGVLLADAQRTLSLFTQGIAGRYLHLRPTDALAGSLRGDLPTTDGSAIFLPERIAVFADERANFGFYRIAVLHQLGFFREGTFAFSLAEARRRCPDLPAARAALPSRAVELERFFALAESPLLLRRLFMLLEDMRIDARLAGHFPGARGDLGRALAQARAERPPLDALDPIASLLETLVQFTLGVPRDALLAADATGVAGALLSGLDAVADAGADVHTSAAAAWHCYRVLDAVGLPRRANAVPHAGDDGTLLPLDAVPGTLPPLDEDALSFLPVDFRGDVRPELVQRQQRLDALRGVVGTLDALLAADELPDGAFDPLLDAEAGIATDGPPPLHAPRDDAEAPPPASPSPPPTPAQRKQHARDLRDDARRHVELDRAHLRRAFGEAPAPGSRSFFHDEWDYLGQRWLKGHCRLFEYRLEGDDHDYFRSVESVHGELGARIRRQFQGIRAASQARVRRFRDGHELDLDGVVDAVVDRRAGRAPTDRVYQRRERARREVAAAFLLDMSASTDDAVAATDVEATGVGAPAGVDDEFLYGFDPDAKPAPTPPKRRVIDIGKESLALMCAALETLGDAYAIYGFSGYGHDDVEFHIAKEFAERLTRRTWAALSAMRPRRSTRMGPAIRHAVAKLLRQDARLKVLIIVSDGFPQDCDYGPDRTSHEYGIQDTAKALDEARLKDVQAFCVTVDRSGHDYLRRMCTERRYLVIDEVAALPEALGKVYRALTT